MHTRAHRVLRAKLCATVRAAARRRERNPLPDTTGTTDPNAQAVPAADTQAACRVTAIPGPGSIATGNTREP
jgi:hypothetical protein